VTSPSSPPRSVLVANRGEIARRIFATCRRLGIGTVAVYSDADAASPHVLEADAAVHLPGVAPADTYLRADLLVDAARRAGADAVHPGYGFLSEDAGFARAVLAAGLTWVGPPPEAIEAMGSKLAAKARMAAAGVPVLPGGDVTGLDDGALRAVADQAGYPVLVKASAGGGGRGMRLVETPDQLVDAVASAGREAASAFGDGTVFLERYVVAPRHVEVQVLADVHGNVVHLFERDCSIQRRHQKIVEESPSPAVDDDLRARLGDAAVTAAREVGYVGAGTVEMVLAPDGTFAFLEMNTRLQVEHPVTEAVTGLDLVEWQLRVAGGEPLGPSVTEARVDGHAIEVRLYAEDPADGYRPATGTLHRFEVPALEGIRVDSGVVDGSVVGPHYDPMIAKVVAWAPTRAEAARRLGAALAGARIHGVVTNRDLLVAILGHPEFLDGRTDTAFLERHDPAALTATRRGDDVVRLHAVAAAAAALAGQRAAATTWAHAPAGWRNVRSQPHRTTFAIGERELVVDLTPGRDSRPEALAVDGDPVAVTVDAAGPAEATLTSDGVARRFAVLATDTTVDVDSPLGSTAFTIVPRFTESGDALATGSLVAPMPGAVVRVEVTEGDEVAAGDLLLVLEAMKMEHPVLAPAAGTVTSLAVAAGQQVDAGQVLAVVEVAGG
jgi:propionyl-CoA carboxylase alpha chain